jgi:hypothetical protein
MQVDRTDAAWHNRDWLLYPANLVVYIDLRHLHTGRRKIPDANRQASFIDVKRFKLQRLQRESRIIFSVRLKANW